MKTKATGIGLDRLLLNIHHFMMFGHHPRPPLIDAEFNLNEESYSEPPERDIEQAMENLVKIHEDIAAKATLNISEAQKNTKGTIMIESRHLHQ